MSKNALALVDCNNRDLLFQFLTEHFDRKAVKNEMVFPYDDQLIGKMNFRHGGLEHSMFFTYARSTEYPGMRFRNHKILYLSLGVHEVSSTIFQEICEQFGGFIDHNDDLDIGWQKVERSVSAEDFERYAATVSEASDEETNKVMPQNAEEEENGNHLSSHHKGTKTEQKHGERVETKEESHRGRRSEKKESFRNEAKHGNGRPRTGKERPSSKKGEPRPEKRNGEHKSVRKQSEKQTEAE